MAKNKSSTEIKELITKITEKQEQLKLLDTEIRGFKSNTKKQVSDYLRNIKDGLFVNAKSNVNLSGRISALKEFIRRYDKVIIEVNQLKTTLYTLIHNLLGLKTPPPINVNLPKPEAPAAPEQGPAQGPAKAVPVQGEDVEEDVDDVAKPDVAPETIAVNNYLNAINSSKLVSLLNMGFKVDGLKVEEGQDLDIGANAEAIQAAWNKMKEGLYLSTGDDTGDARINEMIDKILDEPFGDQINMTSVSDMLLSARNFEARGAQVALDLTRGAAVSYIPVAGQVAALASGAKAVYNIGQGFRETLRNAATVATRFEELSDFIDFDAALVDTGLGKVLPSNIGDATRLVSSGIRKLNERADGVENYFTDKFGDVKFKSNGKGGFDAYDKDGKKIIQEPPPPGTFNLRNTLIRMGLNDINSVVTGGEPIVKQLFDCLKPPKEEKEQTGIWGAFTGIISSDYSKRGKKFMEMMTKLESTIFNISLTKPGMENILFGDNFDVSILNSITGNEFGWDKSKKGLSMVSGLSMSTLSDFGADAKEMVRRHHIRTVETILYHHGEDVGKLCNSGEINIVFKHICSLGQYKTS